MTTKKQFDADSNANMWRNAIKDTEIRVIKLGRERARLLKAIRLMKKNLTEGAPWPSRCGANGVVELIGQAYFQGKAL